MEHSQYTQAFDFVFKMGKRLDALEKDNAYYEKKVDASSEKNKHIYEALGKDLGLITLMIQDFRKDLKNCQIELGILGQKIRDSAKKEDIEQLNRQVDELEFGEYITRKEFEDMKIEDAKNAERDN